MRFEIINYQKKFDNELMMLFYQSNFSGRDEFEYVKEKKWISRYLSKEKIIKLAKYNDRIIASIGIIPISLFFGKRSIKGGFFVDNCISPEFSSQYETIFSKLFNAIINSAKKKKYKFIVGWDYESKINNYSKLVEKMGFQKKEKVNWVIGGMEFRKNSPTMWRGKNKLFWKTTFHLLKIYNWTARKINEKNVNNLKITVSKFGEQHQKLITDWKKEMDYQFIIDYSSKSSKNLNKKIFQNAIVATIDERIVGILCYTYNPWTGLMYGNPLKNTDFEVFNTVTIDDFIVNKTYQQTTIPKKMLSTLFEMRNTDDNIRLSGMITDVIDHSESWKINCYKSMGFLEPAVDNGAILYKLTDKKIALDSKKIWHVPTSYIIAPSYK